MTSESKKSRSMTDRVKPTHLHRSPLARSERGPLVNGRIERECTVCGGVGTECPYCDGGIVTEPAGREEP